MNSLAGIDNAVEAVRAVAHGHGLEALTQQHLEYAAAHLRAAWIAEDGQRADRPEQVHEAVASFFRLQAFLLEKRAAKGKEDIG